MHNCLLIQQHFAEIRPLSSGYSIISTDGSKGGDMIASVGAFWTAGLFSSISTCQVILQCRSNGNNYCFEVRYLF